MVARFSFIQYKKTFGVILAGVLFFSLLPFVLSAQTLDRSVNLSITPQFPKPHEQIRLSLSSFSVDLNRATITWYINGKETLSGIDERTFETRAGGAGSVTSIEVRIAPQGGGRIVTTASVRPSDVSILWHAHTYTPPFYRGKALPSSRSFIVFTAIPELVNARGVVQGPDSVVYTWRQLGITLGKASGYGKNRIVLEGEAVSAQPMNISVIATSFDNTLEAQRSAELRVRQPIILFYEKHPTLGIRSEHALFEAFVLEKEEMTLRAEPFYFSLDDMRNEKLRYDWRINNTEVSLPKGKSGEITLRRESTESGIASLSLEIINENLSKVLQEATAGLEIIFGTETIF